MCFKNIIAEIRFPNKDKYDFYVGKLFLKCLTACHGNIFSLSGRVFSSSTQQNAHGCHFNNLPPAIANVQQLGWVTVELESVKVFV